MLRRQRFVADQRFDLPQYNRMLDKIEFEFRTYNKHFITAKNKIVKNFKVEAVTGLTVRVNQTTDSLLYHSELDGSENLVLFRAADDAVELALSNNATNYVELEISKVQSASETVAIWDAVANAQEGEEFSQISDTCLKLGYNLVSNTVAFTGDSDKIPLAIVTTSGGIISGIVDDVRTDEFFYHLKDDFNFGVTRSDLGITTLKEAYDAVTTSIKEMKSTPNWFDAQGISTMDLLERSNYMLIDGGKIDWEMAGVETLRWGANLTIMAPNQSYDYTIDAQSVTNITDGDVVYVTFPDVGVAPVGSLTVNKVANGSYLLNPDNTRSFIIAYRSGSKIYFGNGWQNIELESGEQNELGDGITTALLIAGGLTDENDSTPPYTSTFIVTPGTSWTNAISQLDTVVQDILDLVTGTIYTETILSTGHPAGYQFTLPAAEAYGVGKNQLEIYFDGRLMCLGDDYIEIDDGGGVGTKIELLYSMVVGVKVKFRIGIGGAPTYPIPTQTDIEIQNEGTQVESAMETMNFVGAGVSAVQTAAGAVNIIIPGIAGGPSALPPSLLRQNTTGATIPASRLLYILPDDTIAMTDADVGTKGAAIAISTAEILDTAFGDIYTLGWVIPGVLDGVGALPGETIYMSESEGLMVQESGTVPGDVTDVIFKIGVATNLVGGEAKDLIMQAEREIN